MTSNQKPIHHRPLDKLSALKLQKQKQRNSINQVELSEAMAFLSGDALTQACSLLVAQSRDFYSDDKSNKTTSANADAESSDTQPSSSSVDYSQQLFDIYQKSKRAHEIITKADELGQLERSSGNMATIPSSPHPNFSTTTPKSALNTTPGVAISSGNSMPPPPPMAGNATSIPSLHRRGISGSSGVPLNNTRLHLKRKPTDGAADAVNTPKLHRSNSNSLGGATKPNTTAEESKSNPPEAVLNFLKKLNSNGAADEGGNPTTSMPNPTPPMATEAKKRKAASPLEIPLRREVKRSQQPPPPPAATTPSNKSNTARSNTPNSKETPSPEDKPGRRSARSTSKRSTPDNTATATTIHEIGQSVMVRSDNTWYAAIVKDVCYDNGTLITYEVEFDNGEISSGVLPVDVRDNEDD